jgi:hypothetical protein
MKNAPIRNTALRLCISLLSFVGCASAADMTITPFSTFNQNPLAQIYGLPHDTSSDIVSTGSYHVRLTGDLSSNYRTLKTTREQIVLDGETSRTTLAARYGIAQGYEAGIEIPYISLGGGFLDSFIIDWHNMFGLPQGGRDSAPKNRLNYSYSKDGVQKVSQTRDVSGVGDISLTGGIRLYDSGGSGYLNRVSLKGAVKFPTGESKHLLGSGGTDIMLQFCGSMERGTVGLFGSVGGVAMSRGTVLADQHTPFAGVATLGAGWVPASWITFKVQLNGSTPLYSGSSLAELAKFPLLLVIGGAVRLPGEYLLDIGVGEDVAVGTVPDVSFHLGVSRYF